VKVALLCLSLAVVALTSCTTLANRRDMYCGYGRVRGPYTTHHFTKRETVVVTQTASSYKDVVK
jgi:hypothetical protein